MKKHLSKDPIMASIIKDTKLDYIEPSPNVFNALLSSITSQQLSTTVAAVIYGRICALYKRKTLTPKMILETEREILRGAGLSNPKTNYFYNIANFFNESSNKRIQWSRLTDDEIIAKLVEIKGVGKWTVQMILMFTLDRPDVFPVDDLGIQLSIKEHYGITSEKKELRAEMNEIAEKWAPYRTLASRYLWAARDK